MCLKTSVCVAMTSLKMSRWAAAALLCILIIASRGHPGEALEPGCELPPSWSGEWSLSGEREAINVTASVGNLGLMGHCASQQGTIDILGQEMTKTVLWHSGENCFRCILFLERHPNVLQFKEGPCEAGIELEPGGADNPGGGTVSDDMMQMSTPPPLPLHLSAPDTLCDDFVAQLEQEEPDSNLHKLKTMLKLFGEDEPCPFTGTDYSVVYTTGTETCARETSRAKSCLSPTQVSFQLESCAEDSESNSREELLTCKASWLDESLGLTYIVGFLSDPYLLRLGDHVKCFLMQDETHQGGEEGKIRLAQASDGDCDKLKSLEDGQRIFDMTRDLLPEPTDASSCLFPDWASSSTAPFLSFSFTSQYSFSPDGLEMLVSNYSVIAGKAHLISSTACLEILEEMSIDEAEAEQEENPENGHVHAYVKMVTEISSGCQKKFKCLGLYRRTESIFEMQEGHLVEQQEEACSAFNFELRLSYTTLIKSDIEPSTCTAHGHHNVTQLFLRGSTDPCGEDMAGFKEVISRCKDETSIEFIQECGGVERNSVFKCLGGWEKLVPYDTLPGEPGSIQGTPFGQYGGRGFGATNKATFTGTIADFEYMSEDDDVPENVTLGFMIAVPESKTPHAPKRICFLYTYFNQSFSWTADTGSCPRHVRPGRAGIFRFNSTQLEPCTGTRAELSLLAFLLVTGVVLIFT